MRIAHLPSTYLPEHLGGTEMYVRHLCQGLAACGHASAVVWHTDSPCPVEWSGPESQHRLPPYPPQRIADLYEKTRRDEPPGFDDFLTTWRPDIVHFHALTVGAGHAHFQVAVKRGIPCVMTFHTPAMTCPRGSLLRYGDTPCDGRVEPRRCAACTLHGRGWPTPIAQLASLSPFGSRLLPDGPWTSRMMLPSLIQSSRNTLREVAALAAHNVVCARFFKDVLLQNEISADRLTVLRQALPGPDRRVELRLPAGREGQPLRLGFFGRVTQTKGLDLFAAASGQLAAAGVRIEAEVVGPIVSGDAGWVADQLRREPAIRHLGTKRNEELAGWLRSLDLVVIPSRCLETGPLTLLEAWAEGVPAIGSDLGGIQESLEDEGLRSLLFPPNNVPALVRSIQSAMSWSGPRPVVTVPGVDRLVDRMVAIYENAVESRVA